MISVENSRKVWCLRKSGSDFFISIETSFIDKL